MVYDIRVTSFAFMTTQLLYSGVTSQVQYQLYLRCVFTTDINSFRRGLAETMWLTSTAQPPSKCQACHAEGHLIKYFMQSIENYMHFVCSENLNFISGVDYFPFRKIFNLCMWLKLLYRFTTKIRGAVPSIEKVKGVELRHNRFDCSNILAKKTVVDSS